MLLSALYSLLNVAHRDLFGWFISGPWYIDLTGNRLADGTKFQVGTQA